MHLVPEGLKQPNKERLSSEKIFKWTNKMVLAVQLACWLYATASMSVASGKTFDDDMWTLGRLDLKPALRDRLSNCTPYEQTISFGPFTDIHDVVNLDNLVWRLAGLAFISKMMIAVAALLIVIGFINKMLFDLNVFKWQYKNFILRKDILTVFEMFLVCFVISAADDVDRRSSLLRDYLSHCDALIDTTLPYQAPYIEIYFSMALLIFMFVLGLIIHMWNAHQDELIPLNEPGQMPSGGDDDQEFDMVAAGSRGHERSGGYSRRSLPHHPGLSTGSRGAHSPRSVPAGAASSRGGGGGVVPLNDELEPGEPYIDDGEFYDGEDGEGDAADPGVESPHRHRSRRHRSRRHHHRREPSDGVMAASGGDGGPAYGDH